MTKTQGWKKPKMGSKGHRQLCQIHVNKRALQYYGVSVSPAEYEQIVSLIQRNKVASAKMTNTRSVSLVPLKGKLLPVVYDKKNKLLHTVLHPKNIYVTEHYGELETLQQRPMERIETSQETGGVCD